MSGSRATRGIPSLPPLRPRGRSLSWRRDQLVAAGYDELAAHRLAADSTVDIHMLVTRKETSGRGQRYGKATGRPEVDQSEQRED